MREIPVTNGWEKTRHALRTRLNHIVGYGDILRQDASESGRAELEDLFGQIHEVALSLREPMVMRFTAPPEHEENSGSGEKTTDPASEADLKILDRQIYGILFDLIAKIQDAKRRADDYDDKALSGDVGKILEAANGVLEILAAESPSSGAEKDTGILSVPSRTGAEMTEVTDRLDAVVLETSTRIGRILVVDDNLFNRELLARHLERQGHTLRAAADGLEALAILGKEDFDVMILDVMMPGMNGYQLLERIRGDERFGDLYVIVISALGDTQSIARCIQLGAEDYLPREFEPVILKARIESCLEKKNLKAEQALYVAALVEAQERLRSELRGGASYVRSLLPPRIASSELRSDWLFIPSAALGGDVFGYHRIDSDLPPAESRLALYLIDVSGHGIEAALFSVTLMNMLKTQVLPGADFGDPSSVFGRLNASFRMEDQNNLYFTAWYGVWDPVSRELVYASAGSPPAVLVLPGGGAVELATDGMIIGLDAGTQYRNGRSPVPKGSRLFLFSDGIYEIRTKNDVILGLEPFIGILSSRAAETASTASALGGVLQDALTVSARTHFTDDVSLVEFYFD